MTIKEQLKCYYTTNKDIDRLVDQMQHQQDTINKMRVVHALNDTQLCNEIGKLERIVADLQTKVDDLVADLKQVDAILDKLPTQDKLILYYKYCEGLTDTETAHKLGYKDRSKVAKRVPALLFELDAQNF